MKKKENQLSKNIIRKTRLHYMQGMVTSPALTIFPSWPSLPGGPRRPLSPLKPGMPGSPGGPGGHSLHTS